jgi:hypothetical protein
MLFGPAPTSQGRTSRRGDLRPWVARTGQPSVDDVGRPVPKCPIRPGDPCTLCHPGAHGPEDCGLVWLVMTDPDLRDQLAEIRREVAAG